MKKLSMIYLTAISIALFGCVKSPILELEEKGLKRLTSKQSLDLLCNGNFMYTYTNGTIAHMTTDNCKYNYYVITKDEEWRGTLNKGAEGEVCSMEDFGKGKKIDPPQKWCNKEVIFKTNENEWTVFRNDKKSHVIINNIIRLGSKQRLESFCNDSFETTYEWGKASMEVNDCNYVWTNLGNGEVYEGTLIESPEGEECTLRTKAKGKVFDPPRKRCIKSVTFKTGDNEWKAFKEGKLNATIVKK